VKKLNAIEKCCTVTEMRVRGSAHKYCLKEPNYYRHRSLARLGKREHRKTPDPDKAWRTGRRGVKG
jgi:hypothetical protein